MRRIFFFRTTLLLIVLLPALFLSKSTQASQGGPALKWQRTWGGSNDEQTLGLAVDSGGNIYGTGVTTTFGLGNGDVFLLKYNASGSLLWQRTLGGVDTDVGTGVAVNSSGDVYVAGYSNSSDAGGFDAILLKFNSTGSLLWQRSWGGKGNDLGYSVALDSNGGVYVAGETNSFGAGGSDAFVLKTDALGNLLWARTWGGSDDDSARSIAVDTSGNIYVAGYTLSFDIGVPRAFLLKLNSTADLLWQRIWGGNTYARAFGVAVDSSRNVYSTGSVSGFGAYGGTLLLKYNSTGSLLWQRTWGESNTEEGRAVSTDQDGSVYVTGLTKSFGYTRAFLVKYNATAGIIYQRGWGGPGLDIGYAVTTDTSGNPIVAGTVGSSSYGIIDIMLSYHYIDAGDVSYGNSTLGTPPFTLSNPSGALGIPQGSQTYAGGQDAFIFRYSRTSFTVTFQVYGGGWIDFFGQAYGQSYCDGFGQLSSCPPSGDLENGTYAAVTACAFPGLPYGVSSQQNYCAPLPIKNWTTSGGVSVSDPKQNPTNVTVTGPGTLTAYLQPGGSILPSTILLTTIGITIAMLISKKRKGK